MMTSDVNYNINKNSFFQTAVYSIKNPDFMPIVSKISTKYLAKVKLKKKNEVYPVNMTENYFNELEIVPFSNFILRTAWEILKSQGYYMDNKQTFFTEMWTQEHGKHSMMEQHTHKFGSQIVGFYFLETPKNCSKLLVHDPRPAKMIVGLDENNENDVTDASDIIHFTPEPGLMLFTNGWLPHSFTRHESDKPIKFVHFNVSVAKQEMQLAEVI